MRWALAMTAAALASGAMAEVAPKAAGSIRFATFNAALNERMAGGIVRRLEGDSDAQAKLVAEVIQRVRPDVLVLQELDRDPELRALTAFQSYLRQGQGDAEPIDYPFALFPESNTGVLAGVDLDGDGEIRLPNDTKGFGFHPGQYAFALLSRHPLGPATTYGDVLWRDVPGALVPTDYYSEAALGVLPLSSKTHVAVPVEVPGGAIRVLAAHPTPPVFDDPKINWNGLRNSDEIGLLVDMLAAPGCSWLDNRALAERAAAVVGAPEANATPSGAGAGALVKRVYVECASPAPHAVVIGDLNADVRRGDALRIGMTRLLDDPRINDVVPSSTRGDITARFNGGMRVDYVLPTEGLVVTSSGVFWPADDDPLARLNEASDHHLVWVDVRLP